MERLHLPSLSFLKARAFRVSKVWDICIPSEVMGCMADLNPVPLTGHWSPGSLMTKPPSRTTQQKLERTGEAEDQVPRWPGWSWDLRLHDVALLGFASVQKFGFMTQYPPFRRFCEATAVTHVNAPGCYSSCSVNSHFLSLSRICLHVTPW